MNTLTQKDALSREAREVVEMINDMAVELMFCAYEDLSPGMQMKLSNLARDTHRMLGNNEDAARSG
jgi:hypothetical protein